MIFLAVSRPTFTLSVTVSMTKLLLKELQHFGLSKNLSTVYLALFEVGEAKAGELIRKTGLHRNLVYTALNTLEEKKLITKISRRGIAVYKSLDPATLMRELREKESLALHIIETLQTMKNPNKQEVIVHEGLAELRRKEIELYTLPNKNDTMYVIGISPLWYNTLGKKTYEKICTAQQTHEYTFQAMGSFPADHPHIQSLAKQAGCDIRAKGNLSSEATEMIILSDRVVISLFVEPYTCIEIVNAEIARNYIRYFELLWKQETQTYSGWKEIESLFFDELLPAQSPGDTEFNLGAGYGDEASAEQVADFYLRYNTARTKKCVHKKLVFFEHHREAARQEFIDSGDEKFEYAKLKYLPSEFYTPMQTHIIAGNLILVMWGENPVATRYQNPNTVAAFQKQFDFMWETAKW